MEHRIEKENGNTTHYFLATEAEVKDYFAKCNDSSQPSFWDAMYAVWTGQYSTTIIILRWDDEREWNKYWRIRKLLEEEWKTRKKS